MRALLDDPEHLALEIIELRAYARTKEQLDAAKRAEDAPRGPVADLVMDIQAEIFRRRKEAETDGNPR